MRTKRSSGSGSGKEYCGWSALTRSRSVLSSEKVFGMCWVSWRKKRERERKKKRGRGRGGDPFYTRRTLA